MRHAALDLVVFDQRAFDANGWKQSVLDLGDFRGVGILRAYAECEKCKREKHSTAGPGSRSAGSTGTNSAVSQSRQQPRGKQNQSRRLGQSVDIIHTQKGHDTGPRVP